MKKIFYSTLAVTCSVVGITISHANINTNRVVIFYKYIGPKPVSTCALVNNPANWQKVTALPTCPGSIQACSITTTIPATTTLGIHPSSAIPCAQTVLGTRPRFTAATGNGVKSVFSDVNS